MNCPGNQLQWTEAESFERRQACNIVQGMKEVQVSNRVMEKEGQTLQAEGGKAEWQIIEQNRERHT